MKTKSINICIAFILFQIGLVITAIGQSLTVTCEPPYTCSYALPNKALHEYSVAMNSFAKCDNGKNCKYKWEVTNGHIISGTYANPSVLEANGAIKIAVEWDNTNGNGVVKVTSTGKPNPSTPECDLCPSGITQTKTIPIRYLGTPGNIKINGVAQSGSYQINCGTAPINVAVDPATNATNYVWTYPPGWTLSGSGNIVTLTPNAGSGGVIKVTASRNDVPGLTTSSQLTITRPVPTKPVINSPDILLCNPKTITATASNATSYNWVATGGITANSPGNTNSAQITGVSDGTVKVSATSSVCGVTSAFSTPINVKRSAPQPASLLVTANGGGSPDFMCNGAGVMLNAYTAEPETQFGIWTCSDPGNTILNSNGGTAYFNSYVNNCYGIDITVSNCFGSVQKGITICVDNCAKGTPIYKVFPNPAKDQVKIQFDDGQAIERLPQTVRLLSEVGGKEVRAIDATAQYVTPAFEQDRTITLPVSDLPKGIYYLILVNRDGTFENVRLILE
ncbi:T9SS type A sorting domain-containing protein [Dyadobacter fermentans]|uniref:T9SS type A sorting domain-containing protein n=1 Tax=Dyadobacter fermentans TaxID=94254 RepID=UPI0033A249BB